LVSLIRLRPVVFLGCASLALAAAPSVARADGDENVAAAEALFTAGRQLVEQGKVAEGCQKFNASYKLAPALGTLLNLADCYEKAGQYASAWARFTEAISQSQRANRPDREKTARDRASKLEPKLSRMTIVAPRGAEDNVEIRRDGTLLDSGALGTAVPVDPGKHVVEARAKGKKTWTTTVEVGDPSKPVKVEVPALEAAAEDKPKPPPPPKDEGTSGMKIGGLVMAGLGVVGIGVGSYFGVMTFSKWSDAKSRCKNGDCDQAGFDAASAAKTNGNVSTVGFVAGGVLLAGGAALFFLAPGTSSAPGGKDKGSLWVAPQVAASGAGAAVGGRFW